ncbi:YveK family protein [Acidaminobacter hydrogenoformans]|uniref:Capsular polysaccharide biosynthesis protein n=1 Tax=Acidaminobacter hydrogenoformans DSM 2784 TaxID=1120920 RepID=A0A1G5RPX9_9FIRM|nr:Wzz/FepE/Etk N-terminal domain-containing protein [Acidaminobacter hydrogenoformans]SCZ76054.1 Capsular polysaccharide biosynthesis protein [Acidaminobacter hydrogenoformans DSM 2784]
MRQYDEMNVLGFRDVFYVFLKRIKIIAGLTLLSLTVSIIVTFFLMTPKYETFTILMLGRPADYGIEVGITAQDVQLNRQLVSTYAEIAKSNSVINQVSSNWGDGMTPLYIRERVKVTLLNNTELIKVTARDADPIIAAKLANQMAETFMKEVAKIMKIENVQIIDKAEIPRKPVSPRPELNLTAGTLFGMLSGAFLAFFLEITDQSIKTSDDVVKLLNLPVLGMIPEMTEER